jgi:tRNA nucleotidyltransferase (CCA-adding enzyme)
VAKPRCAAPKEGAPGEHTFYDHERVGAALTEEILLRLKLPRREAAHAALLVREHNWHYQPEWNDATVRRTIARIGPLALPDLWKLRRADLSARGRLVAEGLANQAALEERFDSELRRAAALKISDLTVSGSDLMTAFGLRPGPVVGRLLSVLLEKVIDDPELNTRDALLRLASEQLQKLSTDNPQ